MWYRYITSGVISIMDKNLTRQPLRDQTHLCLRSILQLDLRVHSEVPEGICVDLEKLHGHRFYTHLKCAFHTFFTNTVGFVIFFSRSCRYKFERNISLICWLAFDWYVAKVCTIPCFCDMSGPKHKCLQNALRSANFKNHPEIKCESNKY